MASIRLEALDKTYPGGHVGVRGLDLEVADGELLVLVGPSGCGKTTALRLIAGLETPTRGRVLIGETDVTPLPPQRRDLAMVFQNYALYPHMSVAENLGFGLRMRGMAREARLRRVREVAALLGLEPLLERRPARLSGGEQQRVALGRAIAREPRAFLLDEPLSNLDARLRARTRTELARLHRRLGATMLYVTHDCEEAMTLGDRIAVLKEGCLQQLAPPTEVYHRPANAFVAELVGSPAMNLIACRITEGVLVGPGLRLDVKHTERAPAHVLLGVRPHDVELSPAKSGDAQARVDVVEALGNSLQLHLEILGGVGGPHPLRVVIGADSRVAVDDRVGVCFRPDALHLFDAANGARLAGARLAHARERARSR